MITVTLGHPNSNSQSNDIMIKFGEKGPFEEGKHITPEEKLQIKLEAKQLFDALKEMGANHWFELQRLMNEYFPQEQQFAIPRFSDLPRQTDQD